MGFLYSTTNLITSTTLPEDNATYRSSEDALYQVEFFYNQRPSKPFRWAAMAGNWIKVDLGSRQTVSLFAIFGHNLTAAATQQLHCSGHNGAWKLIGNLDYRQHDEYLKFGVYDRWFRFSVSDAANPAYPQIGEAWLGNWSKFDNAKTQSPRGDGPQFWTADNVTPFGQDWDAKLSENETFSISLRNVNAPSATDDIQTFLTAVFDNGNRFVMIPDEDQPKAYFCKILNKQAFANRIVYGDNELRDWRLDIKTLTRGITLL